LTVVKNIPQQELGQRQMIQRSTQFS